MFFRATLVVAVFACLTACSPGLPPGVSFSSAAAPPVVLNQQGQSWRLLVEGKDVTSSSGLHVDTSGPAGALVVAVSLAQATAGLPKQFSLQVGMDGAVHCVECAADRTKWSRSER